jgi:hypothetical protein
MIKEERLRAHSTAVPIATNLNLMGQNGFGRNASGIVVVHLQRDFVRSFSASGGTQIAQATCFGHESDMKKFLNCSEWLKAVRL